MSDDSYQSRRDRFACAALQALVIGDSMTPYEARRTAPYIEHEFRQIAESAFELADVMLAASEKKGGA